MKTTNKEEVSFGTGYKARNIASLQDTIDYKLEEMHDLLEDILTANLNDDLNRSVSKGINLLKDDGSEIIGRLFAFGEFLKSNITWLKDQVVHDKTKKLIYHFGNLAKLIEDSRLKNQAVQIASLFLAQ